MICDTIERLVTIFTSHFYYTVCTLESLNDEIYHLWLSPMSQHYLAHFLACHILIQIKNTVYHFKSMAHFQFEHFFFSFGVGDGKIFKIA